MVAPGLANPWKLAVPLLLKAFQFCLSCRVSCRLTNGFKVGGPGAEFQFDPVTNTAGWDTQPATDR